MMESLVRNYFVRERELADEDSHERFGSWSNHFVTGSRADEAGLSVRLYNEGRYLEAGRLLNEVVKENPRNAASYYYLGVMAIDGNYDDAIEYLRMGMIYEKLGKKGAAIAEYKKSLDMNPGLDEAKKALSNIR